MHFVSFFLFCAGYFSVRHCNLWWIGFLILSLRGVLYETKNMQKKLKFNVQLSMVSLYCLTSGTNEDVKL
jgi:hypothetical protein